MPEVGRSGVRLRRLRESESIRRLVRETDLQASRLIAPVFVRHGEKVVEPIESMPGVNRYSLDQLDGYVTRLWVAGIRNVLLFGLPGGEGRRTAPQNGSRSGSNCRFVRNRTDRRDVGRHHLDG
jgi:delta-aminolevulinic acid dehydratase/porphobilinogen synthase